MLEILMTVCLAAGTPCAERLLPVAATDHQACAAGLAGHVAGWQAAHPGHVVSARACVPLAEAQAALPPLSLVEIAPGVFVHTGLHAVPGPDNRGDTANLGVVIGETGIAVIDAGASRGMAERLYLAIRERSGLPIRALILTHMHPDHTMGASVFREAGAEVMGHARLGLGLANRAASYETALRRLLGDEVYLGSRLIGPDVPPGPIDLGGRVLEVEAHGLAHTDNDVTVFDAATGTLFAGDLVFSGHVPALDGSILGWQAVLDGLASRQIGRVVPGHGPAALDWPIGAAPIRSYLAALTAETRAAIARGESIRKAIGHVGESQRGDWRLFDEFNARNATAAYTELEWE